MLLPGILSASPVACPTESYADYLTPGFSCTVSIYTITGFTFSSTALNAASTPYTAADFTASGYDQIYNGNDEFYYGIDYTGTPSEAAGQAVSTDIGLTIDVTDGSNQLNAISLALQATAGPGGGVTLTDTGTASSGDAFSIATSTTVPLAQAKVGPSSSIVNNAVLTTDGPDSVQYFTIKIADIVATPEPSTWLLLAVGLGLIGTKVYRKRSAAV
jgi:hypothetical protein